jgi:hypothetical protein
MLNPPQASWHTRQDFFEPFERPDVPFRRRRFFNLQNLRRFGRRQMFEVPQRQYFAIDRFQGVESILQTEHSLGPDGCLRRGSILAQKMRRQGRGTGRRQ